MFSSIVNNVDWIRDNPLPYNGMTMFSIQLNVRETLKVGIIHRNMSRNGSVKQTSFQTVQDTAVFFHHELVGHQLRLLLQPGEVIFSEDTHAVPVASLAFVWVPSPDDSS